MAAAARFGPHREPIWRVADSAAEIYDSIAEDESMVRDIRERHRYMDSDEFNKAAGKADKGERLEEEDLLSLSRKHDGIRQGFALECGRKPRVRCA